MELLYNFWPYVSEGFITAVTDSQESNASLSVTAEADCFPSSLPRHPITLPPPLAYIMYNSHTKKSLPGLFPTLYLPALVCVCVCVSDPIPTPPAPTLLSSRGTICCPYCCILYNKFCAQIRVRRKPKIDQAEARWKSSPDAAVGLMMRPFGSFFTHPGLTDRQEPLLSRQLRDLR